MTVIGIDFGTANAMVGYFDGHAARIIPNAWGAELTPTVVNVAPQGEVTVGAVAKARGALAPQATAAGFKPFLGTPKRYVLRGQQYTPIELTALVLKSLRADAIRYLEEPVSEAVLSVPAYFDNRQRGALIEAAKLAGLTVVRLIGEATAAALAVQAEPTEVQRILVMDMGADQFTVSLLQRVEGTTQIMQQAVANHLGGNDFTHALVADFAAGAHLTGIDTAAYQQLFDQVAELKKTAPTAANTLTVGDRDYAYGVTAAHLKDVFAPLLGAMRVPLAQVLHSAGLRLTDIDQVVLAGAAGGAPRSGENVPLLAADECHARGSGGHRAGDGCWPASGLPDSAGNDSRADQRPFFWHASDPGNRERGSHGFLCAARRSGRRLARSGRLFVYH